MGMISRVRGRIRSDSFSKIPPVKSEDKIANIGNVYIYSAFFKNLGQVLKVTNRIKSSNYFELRVVMIFALFIDSLWLCAICLP